MIEKQLQPGPSRKELTGTPDVGDIEVELPEEEGDGDQETHSTADKTSPKAEKDFYKNIAEDLDDSVLGTLVSDIDEMFENDLRSRDSWEKTYEEGMKLLGLGIEERTEPWDGACGVVHPLMAESAVRFQAESITEIFSAQGICKSTIIGKTDDMKDKAAKRVENDINWRLTTQMKEYRPEHERMLWSLAITGSAFKKVYFDPSLDRQTSVFVAAEDLIVPYGATDISTAPRISHRMRKSLNDIKKLQNAGFYRDVELDEPTQSSKQSAADKITGMVSVHDDRLELIEMQVDLEIEGYEDVDSDGDETGIMIPYIVTYDRQTKTVLSIYRNWKIDDDAKIRTQHFVHYIYIPGFGFYGMGLVHLVGGFAKSATSLLRQLVDAGTLANLPAGFKAKGIRIQSNSDPLQPGEFRDVDCASGTLRDNIVPLPFKEPSGTLLQLFNEVVEEGRRMAAVSDINAADMNQEAPVGTTLAILERSLKVMTAIQARLHASLKEELSLLKEIIKDQLPEEYDYDVEEGRRVKQADYEIAEIIPVSDPNAATMSQRVVQYQAVIQMAQANPSIYDQVELNRQMLLTLGIKNVEKLIPSSVDQTPKDPITENQAIINGKPVKAFAYQDHVSHLTAHSSAQQDPKIQQLVGQMPQAQNITAAMNAHILEHIAMEYRNRIEQQMGVPLPQGDEKMTPDTEKQLSVTMAQAAQQLLSQHQTEAAQQAAKQAAQDPVLQQQQQQLQVDKDKNRIAEKKVDNDREIAIMQIKAKAATIDDQHQHEDKTAATNHLIDAAKFDEEQKANGKDPQHQQVLHMQEVMHNDHAHQQNMQHNDQAHQQGMQQTAVKANQDAALQEQSTQHAVEGHQAKLQQNQEVHQQRIKQAEEQRRIAAAVAAARPHLKGGDQ